MCHASPARQGAWHRSRQRRWRVRARRTSRPRIIETMRPGAWRSRGASLFFRLLGSMPLVIFLYAFSATMRVSSFRRATRPGCCVGPCTEPVRHHVGVSGLVAPSRARHGAAGEMG